MLKNAFKFGFGATLLVGATASVAQERSALVIANSAYEGPLALPSVRETALDMSETLFGLGFTVSRLENPSLADFQAAVTALQSGDGPLVIYYAGHGFAHDGATYLQPVGAVGADPAELATTSLSAASLFAAGGTDETMVFLDACHGAASQTAIGQGALDRSLADTTADIANLLTVTSVQPGVACPADMTDVPSLTTFLIERLTVPGMPSTEIVPEIAALPALEADTEEGASPAPGLWAATTLTEPFVFRTATSDVRLTPEDYAVLENMSPAAQQQMLAMWRQSGIAVDFGDNGGDVVATTNVEVVADDGIVLVAPVASAQSVAPVAVASVGTVNDGVVIFDAAPAPAPTTTTVVAATPTVTATGAVPTSRPVPGAGGLPLPSIIVGFPEVVVEASFDTAVEDVGPVSGSELAYDNLESRRAMRDSDAALFASLVEGGAFDPPAAQLAVALQTELQRMGCYTSRIDGDWGRGSRAAAARYYDEVEGAELPSQDPDVRIFRQIVMKDDVECPPPPAPVAAAPRRATTTQAAPRRQTTQAAPAPRRQAAPAPAPAPAAPARRTLSATGGTGVFR